MEPGELSVVLLDRQRRRRVSPARLRRVLRGAARALGVSGELALVLTGDRAIRALNARYRGKDKPTDVLSFPGGQAGLGDVVISVESAWAIVSGARLDFTQGVDFTINGNESSSVASTGSPRRNTTKSGRGTP